MTSSRRTLDYGARLIRELDACRIRGINGQNARHDCPQRNGLQMNGSLLAARLGWPRVHPGGGSACHSTPPVSCEETLPVTIPRGRASKLSLTQSL